ncbi:MAG: sigma 54-interacting transcriptional regulator [Clostridiales bacterium]|nr:sigma 54-interacting transcriptional regulator [Clostridiales bacterium]
MKEIPYAGTKKEVFLYMREKTRSYAQEHAGELTANGISLELNISRALASQYLNELVKDGVAVKISSRPVCFLHRKELEDASGVRLRAESYLSWAELEKELAGGTKAKKDFEKLVGCHSGLSYEVEQCKAAVKYPPYGLPIVIAGQNGTGRAYMAGLVHEYAQNCGLLPEQDKMLIFNCAEYADSQQAAGALFGATVRGDGKERPGYLKRSNGGMLYIADVHCLSMEVQDRLAKFMDTGRYKNVNERDAVPCSTARLILSTGKEPEKQLSRRLLRCLPVIVRIPSLSERSVEEREQLILQFFCQEADRMGREVFISSRVFETLLQYEFPANIEQLRSSIQTSCANALVQATEEENISVYLYHLPEYLMVTARVKSEFGEEQRSMMNVRSFRKATVSEVPLQYYEGFLNEYVSCREQQKDREEFLHRESRLFDEFSDYLIFSRHLGNAKIDAIERVMETVFTVIADKYYVQMPEHLNYVFSRCLYMQMRTDSFSGDERVNGCLSLMVTEFPQEAALAEEICRMVEQSLDIGVNGMSRLLLILGVLQCSQNIRVNSVRGIIICHGYSTASSIAAVANRLTGSHVFEAIDMPIEVSIQEVAIRFKRYINNMPGPRDVILLVDTGSLEDMNVLLNGQTNLNLGIINNVSTRLALDVGSKILKNLSMSEIVQTACEEYVTTYKLSEGRSKKAAVIFVSEAGVVVARRMAELFNHSLPKQIEVEFLGYDYLRLKHREELEEIKKKYEILFLSGTINPEIEELPYIPMEEIISFQEIERINRMLSRYMSKNEIEAFNQQLLKNFSLENVVQHLTILNVDKVLDLVNLGVDQMQRMLHRKFSAQTIIGLNIHISCLIERLVTKTPIETYSDEETFALQQQSFIKIVRRSFREISNHYRVEFPVSEIAYIYDYVIHDANSYHLGKGQEE